MFKSLSPNFMVPDVNAAVKYYVENFEFEYEHGVDGDMKQIMDYSSTKLMWAMVQKNNVKLMLQSKESFTGELQLMKDREIGATVSMYIEVEDVAETFAMVKDKVEIVKEIYKTPYGNEEFIVKDLNGYILYFAETKMMV